MSQFFSLIGNIVVIAVIITYFRQVRNGDSTPNPATWLLWVIVSLMNAVSYFIVVQEDIWQSLIVIITTIGLTGIFGYAAFTGKFRSIGATEKVCFGLAIMVGVLWKATGSAIIANLSLQIIFAISFWPTVRGLLTHELTENKALPWNLAVISYFFVTLGVLTAVPFNWVALGFPIVNGLLGNGSVALIIHLQKKGILKRI